MPKSKTNWRSAMTRVNCKTFGRRITNASFAVTMTLFVPFTSASALDLDGLDDVTMQVIDSDEDLTKAIPRVIELPRQPEGIARPWSAHGPSPRNRDLRDLPSALDEAPATTQAPVVPPPMVTPDVPELHLPGDDLHTPFLQPPDTLIPLPIPDTAGDKAMDR